MVSVAATADNYKLTIPLTDEEEGAMAYLVNYDTGDKIDSVLVEDTKAVFSGDITAAIPARVLLDGARFTLILEPGDLTYNVTDRQVSGGKLNAELAKIESKAVELSKEYKAAADKETAAAIYERFGEFRRQAMMDNISNPVGYMLFLDEAYEMEPAQLETFVAANPSLGQYTRVQKLMAANKNKMATQPGNKFADFEIEYDGVKHRLSDVVGKGDYVLVDFWASWCGPCIRQTAVLKDLYKQYKDQDLKIFGVAVWDEPENTKQAIVKHELPWESWLNGQTIPTDIYGISGIPCIILFGPDGTIISRDKQDDALRADVAAALASQK